MPNDSARADAPPSQANRPYDLAPFSYDTVDQWLTTARSTLNLQAFAQQIVQRHNDGHESIVQASHMFDRLYARLGELLNKEKTITRDDATTFFKQVYYVERRKIEPEWKPPQNPKTK